MEKTGRQAKEGPQILHQGGKGALFDDWEVVQWSNHLQVVVASLGEQTTRVEKWGLGKIVVKQVVDVSS